MVGQPGRQWPNPLHAEHWFRARLLSAIHGDLVEFTITGAGSCFCRFSRRFFARLRLRFLFRRASSPLSKVDSIEEVEVEDSSAFAVETAAVRCRLWRSNLNFEFLAIMMWSSTALQTSWCS